MLHLQDYFSTGCTFVPLKNNSPVLCTLPPPLVAPIPLSCFFKFGFLYNFIYLKWKQVYLERYSSTGRMRSVLEGNSTKFGFLDSLYKRYCTVCVSFSVWLISLSIVSSGSTHVIEIAIFPCLMAFSFPVYILWVDTPWMRAEIFHYKGSGWFFGYFFPPIEMFCYFP